MWVEFEGVKMNVEAGKCPRCGEPCLELDDPRIGLKTNYRCESCGLNESLGPETRETA